MKREESDGRRVVVGVAMPLCHLQVSRNMPKDIAVDGSMELLYLSDIYMNIYIYYPALLICCDVSQRLPD
jgi:hypothetical protein